MTASTLLLLALVAAPQPSDEQRRVVGGSVRIGLLPGQPGELSQPIGAGMGVRIRMRPPARPKSRLVGELAVEHDRFGRSVRVEVELEDEQGLPSGERIEITRAQRLTLTRMLAGVGYAPAGRWIQGRVSAMGGVAVAFYKHPGASPESVSAWKGLLRADAALAFKVHRGLWIELAVEWNVLTPDDPERIQFAEPTDSADDSLVRPFGDYGVVSLAALYAF